MTSSRAATASTTTISSGRAATASTTTISSGQARCSLLAKVVYDALVSHHADLVHVPVYRVHRARSFARVPIHVQAVRR